MYVVTELLCVYVQDLEGARRQLSQDAEAHSASIAAANARLLNEQSTVNETREALERARTALDRQRSELAAAEQSAAARHTQLQDRHK